MLSYMKFRAEAVARSAELPDLKVGSIVSWYDGVAKKRILCARVIQRDDASIFLDRYPEGILPTPLFLSHIAHISVGYVALVSGDRMKPASYHVIKRISSKKPAQIRQIYIR